VRSDSAGDDLLQPGEASFRDDEAAGVVSQGDESEKCNHESRGVEADGKCGPGDGGGGYTRGEQKPPTAAEWAELRREAETVAVVSDTYAGDEWQSHADVITVGNHYII
jgi:hypothetical protein